MGKLAEFPKPGYGPASPGMFSKNRYFRALPQSDNIRALTEGAKNLLSYCFNTPKAAQPQNHT